MKPLKIIVFFAAVFGLLFVISLVFPKEGIDLGKNLHLQFISLNNLFDEDSVLSTYTDSIIQNTVVTDDPEFGYVDTLFLTIDSVSESKIAINMDSIIKVRIDSISKTVYPIELSNISRADLYDFFLDAERCKEDSVLLRILHFGDSQLENDRMTSLLRYRLQKIFGGSGCGLVPAIPLYSGNPTFREEYEGNWIRYTGFGKRDSMLEHDCYGIMSCFTSVPVPIEDELPTLKFKFIKGRKASKYSKLNLYLHSTADNGAIVMQFNYTISDTLTNIHQGYQVLSFKPPYESAKVEMQFDLAEGGRIYGIGFDSGSGIQVDNIAMRGSSGLEFTKSNRQTLDTMINDLNTGMIILQFGGNVVPYITNVNYYKIAFKRELSYIKELFPNVAILVIGPADMSTKKNGKFITYPTLEPVRDALRDAALESNCSFWDMYEAMGGENSIQNFVLAEPPLARTDYIHFSSKGANMMAVMFFDAMMLEYGRFKASGQ